MYIFLSVLIYALCVSADESEERRSKIPFIADAVGNKIPRPSSVPATVGSPVNLLTPDRYEFYTFDESGELVKRLMTLEEIQAIVAAGEDTDGLVTFANDDQPTIAFNYSQPPYTKVHSVVTNVQNVLKAQMEAHKNNPNMQPTFDTPDVSDTWSLILPSIFGNTGVDIVPDKTSSFITPETDTIEIDNANGDYLYSFSKEASNTPQTTISTESIDDDQRTSVNFDTIKTTPVTSVKSTTSPNTVPVTTKSPHTNSIITTEKPRRTTVRITTNVYTNKNMNANIKTTKPSISTVKITPNNDKGTDKVEFTTLATKETSEKQDNLFVPVSTVSYITERSTKKPNKIITTSPSISTTEHASDATGVFLSGNSGNVSSSTNKPQSTLDFTFVSSSKNPVHDHNNLTTITTQSVSPSTTMSSTELISASNNPLNENNANKLEDPILLFDVAQSISQIASDLGGNFAPLPTTSNMLDTTKASNMDIESKENIEIEIPHETNKENVANYQNKTVSDNFVKISMLEPNNKNEQNLVKNEEATSKVSNEEVILVNTGSPIVVTTISDITETTTIDPILSESMGDLLSQVVYQNNDIKTPEVSHGPKENNVKDQDVPLPSKTDLKENEIKDRDVTSPSKLLDVNNNLKENNMKKQNVTLSSKTSEVSDDLKVNNMKDKDEALPLKEKSETEITTTEMPIEPLITSTKSSDISNNNEHKEVTKKVVVASFVDKEITPTTERINKSDDSPSFVSISSHDFINQRNISSFNPQNSVEKDMISKNGTAQNLEISDKLNQKQNFDSLLQQNKDTSISLSNKKSNGSSSVNKNFGSNGNKVSDDNKVINKFNKVSNIPKIDEFKKKIQKINIDDKELANERNNSWKLIPTVPPPKIHGEVGNKYKPEGFYTPENTVDKNIVLDFSKENQGLEVTTKDLGEDISQFVELCNELAFQYWNDISVNMDKKRSFVFSPYAVTSMLTMMFMGARGATSGEMNEILKLDDMVTFNPHFTLKNISDSIDISPASGVAASAFIRELYSDRSKGKILTFYKERAQQFYNGHVEEINFKLISDIIRRRTNLLVKRYTYGKIIEYMKTNAIVMQPPLAAISTNIFETDCSGSTVDGRDGEMYFVVSPNVRQRRLVPVPAVVYRSNFLAGYDPVLDATAAALGNTNSVISTLFLMPGQQGNIVHADDLEALEKRLLDFNPTTPAWNRLLRTLLPRVGLELQIPRFSHKSIFNISSSLKKMGLKDLFDPEHADLGGVNGPSKNLYLSDMIQLNSFVTCGESVIGEQHHVEEYPESLESVEKVQKRRSSRWLNWEEPRDYQRAFHDPHDVGDAMHLPLHLRPRQARLPARNAQPARLKFDRPFLYFVRHNPSGMILYVGRYNPRLLP